MYLGKWKEFSLGRQQNPQVLSVDTLLEFLTELYNTGLGYSALGTARSAISALSLVQGNEPLGNNPLVKRFIRGTFNLRPCRPRYDMTWDVNTVLNYMAREWPLADITLKNLTLKLIMLVALVTGHRGQSMHLMRLDNRIENVDSVEFMIEDLVKTSRPGGLQPVLVLPRYPQDTNLCVVTTLHKYIDMTQNMVGLSRDKKLFVSFARPHKAVSKDTIARWIRTVMGLAGIDTAKFKAHSTRSASTSAALRHKVPIDTVLKTAGWSNAGTFARFYNKKVEDKTFYGRMLLGIPDKST